jgi:hypothetical protein
LIHINNFKRNESDWWKSKSSFWASVQDILFEGWLKFYQNGDVFFILPWAWNMPAVFSVMRITKTSEQGHLLNVGISFLDSGHIKMNQKQTD